MDRIIKNCSCSLQVWWGDEPVYEERNIYFNNKKEVKEYLNGKLQSYKGEMIECYVYQYQKGKPHEALVVLEIK
ncbi:hypothetical protein AAE250_22710 [Bacteroides sp. GD17]|jgi:hypothetical protein|uniref:hypothetical protein n=1 Tax=Bacteroides sp. GD17 TaxID=3139826 RepID=UPI0025EB7E18|nr:hypothetical protein [uncultured Bacteroides sp.]